MSVKTVTILVTALLVVVAGCTGAGPAAGGDGEATTTETTTATTTAADATGGGDSGEADERDGGTDDDGDASGDEGAYWAPFEFDRPATYTYDIYVADEGEGTLVWDVQEVTGEEVTVRVEYELGGESFESTTTGDRETVRSQLLMTPAGPFVLTTLLAPTMAFYEGEELAVGNRWAYASDEGSLSFEVTGTDTVAGVDCYTTEMRQNETVVHESCIAPDLGLAPRVAYYDEDGSEEFEVVLVEYERD